MDEKPIGVFDSGLGGLTVVKEIRVNLPNGNIVYLGDTARVPYGTRSKETVIKFALEDVKFLLKQNVKCIVIGCNTASSFARKSVRDRVSVPVFDVISHGARAAIQKSRTQRIGVIGTRGTIRSRAYHSSIKKINKKAKVFSYPCPLLVPLIEEGEVRGSILKEVLSKSLKPLKKKRIDTLILGCTHYPIIAPSIQRILDGVLLINPAQFLANNLYLFLGKYGLLNSKKNKGRITYFVTDLTDRFVFSAEMFLGDKVEGRIRKVNLD